MKFCSAIIISCFFSGHLMAASFVMKPEGHEPIYQTQLNKQVYQQTRSNQLQDLIVQSASGEQVPYALIAASILHTENPVKTYKDLAVFPVQETRLNQPDALKIELGQVQSTTNLSINTQQNSASSQTIYLVDLGENHRPFTTFLANWQGQQNQLIQLEMLTSNDLKSWQQNGQAVLLNTQNQLNTGDKTPQILQNSIVLDTPSDARYLQIRPTNNSAEHTFNLNKLSAEQIEASAHKQTLLWQEIQFTNRSEDPKKAMVALNFEAFGHYPASHLNIILPQENTITQVLVQMRNTDDAPWVTVAHAPLFRMTKNGHAIVNPDIEIATTTARYWQLQFKQSSGGIGKENVKLRLGWPPATIIWNARGLAPFNLQVGEYPKLVSQIPIANLLPNYKITDLVALPKATLQPNNNAPISNTWQSPFNYQRYLLWAGLILGVCLLGAMTYSLFKSANKTN